MIKFMIGGREVSPDKMGDALDAAILENVRRQIHEKVGAIRDPETGAFPTVIVRGQSLDDLTLSVEGSPDVIAQVRARLGLDTQNSDENETETEVPPRAFLSYSFDDGELAERIARLLQANGIDTWWADWCISPGDSLRQKIDEGLSDCTHFLVLLTPRSIGKPWVNQEMDAGLVRRLNSQCRFLPIRYELAASALPPLLAGMLSPEIRADEDITQLVNDIHGVSKKPPLGPVPNAVSEATDAQTGYSPAATAIAKLFVERTQHAAFADPQFDVEDLARETGLSIPDVKDGLYELSAFFKDTKRHILVEAFFYANFDQHWKDWNPADDALKLAADIANDPGFPSNCKQIAERYGWPPRRLNPAISYLLERRMLMDYKALGTHPFVIARVVGYEDEIRRFMKSRR